MHAVLHLIIDNIYVHRYETARVIPYVIMEYEQLHPSFEFAPRKDIPISVVSSGDVYCQWLAIVYRNYFINCLLCGTV